MEFVRFPAGSAPLGQQQMFPISGPGTCPCSCRRPRPARADGELCAVHTQVPMQCTHRKGSADTGCISPALPTPGCWRTQTFAALLQTGQRSSCPQHSMVIVPAVGWFSPPLPALLCAELLLGALCPYLQGHPTCWHQHHFHKLQHQEGAWLIASVPLWSPRTPATWPAQSFKSSEILTRNILTRSWSIPAFSHLFRCQYSTQNCT